MKNLILSLVAIFSLLVAPAMAADDKPLAGKKMVFVVKTGEIREAGMGLALAYSATKKGAAVTVILGANAMQYGLKKGANDIFAAAGKTPRQLLGAIHKLGGKIYLCKACYIWHKSMQEDLIEGIEVTPSLKIFEAIMADGAKSLYF